MGEEGEEGGYPYSIILAVDVVADGEGSGEGSERNTGLKETGKQATEREKLARR